MRIRVLVNVMLATCAAMLLLLLTGFAINFRNSRNAVADNHIAESIRASVNDLRFSMFETMLHGVPRAREQWQSRHATLRAVLDRQSFDHQRARRLLQRIHANHDTADVLYWRLTKARVIVDSAPAQNGNKEVYERTASALLLVTQEMGDDALELSQISQGRIVAAQQTGESLIMITGLMVGTFAGWVWWLVRRRVLKPITVVHKGAEILAAGDLDYRLGVSGRDEFAALASAFDHMAQRLQSSSGELQRLNQTLEARVRERTAQLEDANAMLAASTQDLARSNAELEQFAYVASHDLQEPLRMVIGFVGLLDKRLADKLDTESREFMAFAVDGAQRMRGLIQDILAYSRVGTIGATLVPVDSMDAFKAALVSLEGRIAETGAQVDAMNLPMVMADRTQLTQLLQNLIGNAIKFCEKRPPRVQVEARLEQDRWRFSVGDNGIGIAPEYRDRIFGIFQRLHTLRQYPGTGIGLAICRRIVERHGGHIGVEPAAGGGAVFWFTLGCEKST